MPETEEFRRVVRQAATSHRGGIRPDMIDKIATALEAAETADVCHGSCRRTPVANWQGAVNLLR